MARWNSAKYLQGTAGDDRLEGGRGNDTLVGQTGGDTLVGGGGNDDLWGYTNGWGGHAPPDWDNGADTFVFGMYRGSARDGHDTLHITDPAHDDTLLLVDPSGRVRTLEQLESRVTVSNGEQGNFDTQGDVTIAWKDGSGSITLDNFFHIYNPVAEVDTLADLSQHLEIAVARDWA
jgi:Ca2+-binding RTX toxin-like protein